MKVTVAGARGESEQRAIRQLLSRAAEAEHCRAGRLNVVLVSNARIRQLNRRFLGRDRETDVMAFPIGGDLLGEIYVSRDQVRVQARRFGHALRPELLLLVLHGFLHLLGYSHKAMATRYRRYLPRVGPQSAPGRRF